MNTTRLFFLLIATAGLLAGGCASTGSNPNDAPRANTTQIVQRYFAEWANGGATNAASELMAPNVLLHHPHMTVEGLPAYMQSMAVFRVAFPDLHFAVEDQVTEKNRAAVRWVMTGTQRGEFQGQGPSGKKVSVNGVSVFRVENGRIQEIWVSMDRLGFMQQLGLVPKPGPAR